MERDDQLPSSPEPAAGVPWLSPDEARHWLAFVALLEVLPAALDSQLKRDAGMNGYEYMVMAALSAAPGRSMGMSEAADCASGSLSRLSHAVGRLEAKGWVTRSPHGRGKAVDLAMTELGVAVMDRVAPGHVAEARRLVVDVLTPRQLAELGRASRRILEAVDPRHVAVLDERVRTGRGA